MGGYFPNHLCVENCSNVDKLADTIKKYGNFPKSPEEEHGALILLGVFFSVGVFGNIILCLTFIRRIRRKSKRQVCNYAIFALAVADLCSLLIYIPFYSSTVTRLLFDQSACRILEFFGAFFISFGHLVISIAIPLERYFAICQPLRIIEKRECMYVFVFLCIVASAMAIPWAIVVSVYYDNVLIGCHYTFGTYIGEIVPVVYFVAVAIPTTFCLCLYGVIFYRVNEIRKTHSLIVANKEESTKQKETIEKTRVAMMLFGITLFNLSCWLPFFIVSWKVIMFDHRINVFIFFNNSTNFVLYGLGNRKIRNEMWNILICKYRIVSDKPIQSKSVSNLTLDDLPPTKRG